MRKAASLLVSTLIVAGSAFAAAGPAGASAATGDRPSRFCRAVENFDSGDVGNPTTAEGAEKTIKQLRKLRRAARGDTKEALTEIIGAYQEVIDGESAREAFANGDFIEAAGTFAVQVTKCVIGNLPDITLPDISLPDLTLPDLDD